jgi:hypothetical protein
MTKEQAAKFLDQILSQVPLSRVQHAQVQEALRILLSVEEKPKAQ